MEEARRQIQRQLDMIDRQITRRMTALIPQLHPRQTAYRRGKSPDPGAFLERYRANLAAITAERQPEIDALTRKLARQESAIAVLRRRQLQPGRALCVKRDVVSSGRHSSVATAMVLRNHGDQTVQGKSWMRFGSAEGQ